jgi:hypothetical protein
VQSEETSNQDTEKRKNLPIVRSDDVEFSKEAADTDDLEALERAEAAENRQLNNQ